LPAEQFEEFFGDGKKFAEYTFFLGFERAQSGLASIANAGITGPAILM
jgi:hypothetical protein